MTKQSKKSTSSPIVRMAAKVLSNPKTGVKKSDAGKITAKHAAKIRKIQLPPKKGSITMDAARRAARVVLKKK